MTQLQQAVESFLAGEGAIVETIEPDGIEVMAPPALQRGLAMPEWFRLGFGAALPDQAQPVTIESDWLDRCNALLHDRGRYLAVALCQEAAGRFPSDLERAVAQHVLLDNATHRLIGTGEARTRYLLVCLKLIAVSDEKREEIVHVCINEGTGARADHLAAPLYAALADGSAAPETGPGAVAGDAAAAAQALRRALPAVIRQQVRPFLSGMERRMKRDMERIHAYHTDLHREATSQLAAKLKKGLASDAIERDRARLAAIEREYRAKATDLARKYSIAVDVESIQALRASLPVLRAQLRILRRKASRDFALDWNPLSRKLDGVACEACGSLVAPFAACDEHVHLTCAGCHAPCPACGKAWCRACAPLRCAKCGSGLPVPAIP